MTENKKELTLGERRVHLNFNPSSDDKIGQFKRMMADAIDFIEEIRVSNDNPDAKEINRCVAIAHTELETAKIYCVKAIEKTLNK